MNKFEPKKKYVEELVDTDESDAKSVDEDTDDEESCKISSIKLQTIID